MVIEPTGPAITPASLPTFPAYVKENNIFSPYHQRWSLVNPDWIGLELSEEKMGSLPKSFTPFFPSEKICSGKEWVRKSESLTSTPNYFGGEPNNNSVATEAQNLNKMLPQNRNNFSFQELEEEKENFDGGWGGETPKAQQFFWTNFPEEPPPAPEPEKKNEMDTLLTFLSKFDDKVAAIWGDEGEQGREGGGNPWAREERQTLWDLRALRIHRDPPEKYTIAHSMREFFGEAPDDYSLLFSPRPHAESLATLGHSSASAFAPFVGPRAPQIPRRVTLPPAPSPLTVDGEEDLLFSFKTHLRTIEAIEQAEAPLNAILPEFRDVFNEEEYEVYRKSATSFFPIHFMARRENEKGVQTETFVWDPFPPQPHGFFPCHDLVDPQEIQTTDFWNYNDETGDCESQMFYENCEEYGDEVFGDCDDFTDTSSKDADYGTFDYPPILGVGTGKKSNRRKARVRPCKYFFVEGTCRRGKDCKFSHDMITCRYWAEGSCIKGQSCPFLHRFLNSQDFLGQEGEMTKKYQLESESDFPALTLGSTNMSSSLGSRVPMSEGYDMEVGEEEFGNNVKRKKEKLNNYLLYHDQEEDTGNWICSMMGVKEKRRKKKQKSN